MDFSADHISFVLASYVLTFAVLGGLLAWTLWRARAVSRRLSAIDRDGPPRRRASTAVNPS
jgi:heme exporter protein CcmD